MFLIIPLFIIIGCVIAYREATRGYRTARYKFQWRNLPFGWVCGWAFAGVLVAFFGWLFALDFMSDYTPVENKIESLADGTSLHGNFFLGSGSVDDEPVFFYYMETSDGFRLEHVDADITTIREYEGEPYMVRYCLDFSTAPEWANWPFPDDDSFHPDCDEGIDKVIFYVPEGSIKNNYILDAQ